MATYKAKNYDLVEAFRIIEEQLTESMINNLKKHVNDETAEGFNWSMWQVEQLNALHEYKLQSEKFFKDYAGAVSNEIELLLKETYNNAQLQTENEILQAIKGGYKTEKSESNFFKINERKLNALMKATKSDFKNATRAMLRTTHDEYRKIIFNAQVYANTGVGTVRQAIDMATKDFLSKGINCIEYKNGARVPIDSYSEMALRTTNTRATLYGEGTKRKEWNITKVIVTPNASGCPKCLQWVGKVYIDDVWSGGKSKDGYYPLLSMAIEGGLYHPNCRDSHSTYFDGISSLPNPPTREERAEASRVYNLQQRQRYCERNVKKYKRLAEYSLDPDNKSKYTNLKNKWVQNLNTLIKNNPELRLKPERVKTYGIDITKLQFPTSKGLSVPKPKTTKSNVIEIVDRRTAYKSLIDEIGFKEIKSTLKNVDEQLLVDSVNQLRKLEQRFRMIHKSEMEIFCDGRSSSLAYVSSSIINPSAQDLSLCKKYFNNYKILVNTQSRISKSNWNMPCSDEYVTKYTVTHEYGHIIQNILIKQRYIKEGWDETNPRAFYDGTKSTKKERFAWYNKLSEEVENEHYEEIIAIAKENNKDFNLLDNISDYGKSNKAEFFAEVFANSQCGKPNELGKAMQIWLKRKGF